MRVGRACLRLWLPLARRGIDVQTSDLKSMGLGPYRYFNAVFRMTQSTAPDGNRTGASILKAAPGDPESVVARHDSEGHVPLERRRVHGHAGGSLSAEKGTQPGGGQEAYQWLF